VLPFETFLKLSPIACKLYLLIFQLRDESGQCTYPARALAPGIPCSLRSVQRAIAELRTNNLVTIESRGQACMITLPLAPAPPAVAARPSTASLESPPMAGPPPVASQDPSPVAGPPPLAGLAPSPLAGLPTGAIENGDPSPTQSQPTPDPPTLAGVLDQITALTTIIRATL